MGNLEKHAFALKHALKIDDMNDISTESQAVRNITIELFKEHEKNKEMVKNLVMIQAYVERIMQNTHGPDAKKYAQAILDEIKKIKKDLKDTLKKVGK